jgi:plasmid maintenance system antidote protein VapI
MSVTVRQQLQDMLGRTEEFNDFLPVQDLLEFDVAKVNVARLDAAINEIEKLRKQLAYRDNLFVFDRLQPALLILREVVTFWTTLSSNEVSAKIKNARNFVNRVVNNREGLTDKTIILFPQTYNDEIERLKTELNIALADSDNDGKEKLARKALERIVKTTGELLMSISSKDLEKIDGDFPAVRDFLDGIEDLMSKKLLRDLDTINNDKIEQYRITLIARPSGDFSVAPYLYQIDRAIVQMYDNDKNVYRCYCKTKKEGSNLTIENARCLPPDTSISIPFSEFQQYGWIDPSWRVERAASARGTFRADITWTGKSQSTIVNVLAARFVFEPVNDARQQITDAIKRVGLSEGGQLQQLWNRYKKPEGTWDFAKPLMRGNVEKLLEPLGFDNKAHNLNGVLTDTEAQTMYFFPFQSTDTNGLKYVLFQDFPTREYGVIEFVKSPHSAVDNTEMSWIPGQIFECAVAYCMDPAADFSSDVDEAYLTSHLTNEIVVKTSGSSVKYRMVSRQLHKDSIFAVYLHEHKTLLMYVPTPTVPVMLLPLMRRPGIGLSVSPQSTRKNQVTSAERYHTMKLLSDTDGSTRQTTGAQGRSRQLLLKLYGVYTMSQKLSTDFEDLVAVKPDIADELLKASMKDQEKRLVTKARNILRLKDIPGLIDDLFQSATGDNSLLEDGTLNTAILAQFMAQLQRLDAKEELKDLTGVDLTTKKWQTILQDVTVVKNVATSYEQLINYIANKAESYKDELQGSLDTMTGMLNSDILPDTDDRKKQLKAICDRLEMWFAATRAMPPPTKSDRHVRLEHYKQSLAGLTVQIRAMLRLMGISDTPTSKKDCPEVQLVSDGNKADILSRLNATYLEEVKDQLPKFKKDLNRLVQGSDARSKSALNALDALGERMNHSSKGLIRNVNTKIAESVGNPDTKLRYIEYKLNKVRSFVRQASGICSDYVSYHIGFIMRRFRGPLQLLKGMDPKQIPDVKEIREQIDMLMQKVDKFKLDFDKKFNDLFTNNMLIREHLDQLQEGSILESFTTASESCHAKFQNIDRVFKNEFTIWEMVTDAQFMVMYVLKLVRFGFMWMALMVASSIFTNRYVDQVFTRREDPPPMSALVAMFLAIELMFNVVLWVILTFIRRVYQTDEGDFIVNDTMMKRLFVEYAISTAFIGAIGFFISEVIRRRVVFSYASDGVRPVQAFKDMMLIVSGFTLAIPFFMIAD